MFENEIFFGHIYAEINTLLGSHIFKNLYIFKIKIVKATSPCETQAFWLQGRKTNNSVVTRCLRAAITTQDFLVMRYKMSLYISSAFPCLSFLLPMHIPSAILYLSFNHPSPSLLFQPVIAFSHSFHPEHFPFFHSLSICFLFLPPLLSLPPSCSLSLGHFSWSFLYPSTLPLHPLFPLFPLWWMSLSAGCSSYLLSRGAHTVSLSCPPHLYSSTKETERARGYSGMRGGGRPMQRDPLQQSPR